jgi:hypothetical protein
VPPGNRQFLSATDDDDLQVLAMDGRVWAKAAPPPAEHGAEFGFWLPSVAIDQADDR